MALEKITRLAEVLVTFNEDGSFRGAHQRSIEAVYDDGQIVGAPAYTDPAPVAAADVPDILGDALPAVAEMEATHADACAQHEAACAALKDELEALNALNARLQADYATVQGRLDKVRREKLELEEAEVERKLAEARKDEASDG